MDKKLELLAPAKNADYGIEAIRHGADAVYIGAPAFGARASAGNSIEEIKRLVDFAHLFGAKVYVALNTILTDDELPQARQLASKLYEIGADAIIIQDYGLIAEDNLPPIPLHASTQMDNVTAERIRFLYEIGFEQVVIPREFSPNQIQRIHQLVPNVRLECFVHGALCVSYSGRCYAAAEFHGRSANKGACSQVCRLPFDLIDGKGRVLQKNKHLLSIKDLNRGEMISTLISAGVTSFKIEGRLKDLSYLKNIVSHYHLIINDFILQNPEYSRSSRGEVELKFVPNIDKVFNRGYTAFESNGRRNDDLAAFETPKSMGERVGTVLSTRGNAIKISLEKHKVISNGDGLSYFLEKGGTSGVKVNIAKGDNIQLNNHIHSLRAGMQLYRNYDTAFEQLMGRDTADRKISIRFDLNMPSTDVLSLKVSTLDEIVVSVDKILKIEPALSGDPKLSIEKVLNKCGNTPYKALEINIDKRLYKSFVPRSILTDMRQEILSLLDRKLMDVALKNRKTRSTPNSLARYPEQTVDYTANVSNKAALNFYHKHGATVSEMAYEVQKQASKPLMYTKHCIRYSLGLCPHIQHYKGALNEPWIIKSTHNASVVMRLEFNCTDCSMSLYKVE